MRQWKIGWKFETKAAYYGIIRLSVGEFITLKALLKAENYAN